MIAYQNISSATKLASQIKRTGTATRYCMNLKQFESTLNFLLQRFAWRLT
jgi:hypothetical protein